MEHKSKCFMNALSYEFDVDGHTVIKCKLRRKFCPQFEGKCPALKTRDAK